MIRSTLFRSVLSLAAVALGASAANAATITWGTPTLVAGDSDVSTTGNLVMAKHFGNDVDPVVNSVTFTAWNFSYIHNNSATQGDATISNIGDNDNWNIGASVQAAADYAGSTSLSANYKKVLFGGAEAWSDPSTVLTITLAGLTVGTQYQIQSWSVDSRAAITRETRIDGVVTLDENATDSLGGAGQYVIGTFTADAATQAYSFTGVSGKGPSIVNAFQLRDTTVVPEPASLGLLGLAGVAAMRRRRA